MLKRRILSILMALVVILTSFSFQAFASDEEKIGAIKYSWSNAKITATVEVTASGARRTLILSSYKNGSIKELKCATAEINGTTTLSATVSGGVDEITACVVDGYIGKALTQKAVYGTDSTALKFIKVNGTKLSNYSDSANKYSVQVDDIESATVEAVPTDATTAVSVSDVSSSGTVEITVTSSLGKKRAITVNLYEIEKSLYTLSSLSYQIGDEIYEVDNFSADRTSYNVVLPDNTMSVTLLPKSSGNVTVTVSNDYVTSVNGVSLGTLATSSQTAYTYTRNTDRNIIPIKNEKATAYVKAASGGKSTDYTITFSAKQPRLTSFNYVGASSDSVKPAFIGGSAVNNDNGTILAVDRRWAVGNISKSLIGGSCFMLPIVNRDKDSQWWSKNTSGEYFNFTADTSGTIYVVSGDSIGNSEYASWTRIKETPSVPSGLSWRTVAKNWNDYEAKYYMTAIEYQTDAARATSPGIAQTDSADENVLYPLAMPNVAYRSFEAGETVSVMHTGTFSYNAAKTLIVVVWDDVNYGPILEDATDSGTGDDDESQEALPSVSLRGENCVLSYDFNESSLTSSGVLPDVSGRGNSLTIPTLTNAFWTGDGLAVPACVDTKKAITLPTVVTNTINDGDFTIEFEIADIVSESGKRAGIFSTLKEGLNIFKHASNDKVYIRALGNVTAVTMPSISVDKLLSGTNMIVYEKSKDEDGKATFKWYVDGVLTDEKTVGTGFSIGNIILGGTSDIYGGYVVFKNLTVYNNAVSEEEINGGDAQ